MTKCALRVCLLIALIMIIVTACAPTSFVTIPDQETSLPENNDMPERNSMPEVSSEELDTPIQRALHEKLENAFSDSYLDLLTSRFDLTPHFNDALADGDTFQATLLIENSVGQSYAKEIQGHFSYDPSAFTDDSVVNWGGICIVDADTIAIITLDSVVLLDSNSLNVSTFPPDLSVLDENMQVVGIGRIDDGYIVTVVARVPDERISMDRYETSLFLFDSNGTLTDTIFIGSTSSFSRYYSSLEREILYAEQIFLATWENERFVVIPNLSVAYSLDHPGNTRCRFTARYDRDDIVLLISDLPPNSEVALLYDKERLVSAIALPKCNPGIFGIDESGTVQGDTNIRWDGNRTATIENSFFDTTIVLDFTQDTAAAVYQFQADHISRYWNDDQPPQSSDGRYRIIESSGWGGADGLYNNAWLHDMESDQYHFLDIFVSIYGGFGDRCGFIDSNQFYRMFFPGPLSIYKITDSSVNLIHALSDNAIAVTYADDLGYFYVLEKDGESIDVAIWNDAGNLISRNNTAIPVTHHYEGLYSPVISVSGNTMYYESPHLETYIKGTLDLTTFEFLEITQEQSHS